MSNEDTEVFSDGDVVWVKCGTLFWPARVVDYNNLPDEIKEDFPEGNEKPKTIAKFFDEDGYEYLFDNKNIFPYNCSRKEEFIKKGIGKSKSKSKEGATSGWFAKFPNDVILSEKLTGGDEKILEKEPYVEKPAEKINYKELFGQSAAQQDKEKKKAETPKSVAKKRKAENSPAKKTPQAGGKKKKESEKSSTPARPIVHPRFMEGGSGSDHQVKILPQPSAPYHIDLQMKQDKLTSAAPSAYTCSICGFAATRINVIVLHNKSHSEPAKNNSLAGGQRPGSAIAARKPVPSSPATPKEKKKATPTAAASSSTPKQTPKVNNAKKATTASAPAEKPTTTPAAGKATPKTKANSKTEAATKTPATLVAASPAAATTETPRRGRGRPSAAATAATPVTTSATAAPAPAKKSPTKAPAPEPAKEAGGKTRKPRMTKKKKELMMQEKEKKEEERQKIMGEWSEEEEGEAEERKKINESLGKSEDGSDEDFDRDDFLGDDHVHGYDDDDDDEDEPMETEEVKKDEKESEPKEEVKTTNGAKEKSKIEEEREKIEEKEKIEDKVEEEIKISDKGEDSVPVIEEPGFDIDKVLAETSVPELSSDIENVVKKSVKFSPHISKEIALKTIRVMQPESNLLDPQDVDDEFAFTEEPRIPELMATKTILKRSRNKSDSPFKQSDIGGVTSSPPKNTVKLTFNAPAEELTDEDKEQDAAQAAEQAAAAAVIESSVHDEQIPETPILASDSTELSTHIQHHDEIVHEEEHQQQQHHHHQHVQHHSIPTQMLLQTSEGQHIQVHNGAVGDGGEHEGETYILLVDDDENAGAHLESLNSQTLYIDSSSLANGDLSNMVLMTGPPHTSGGEQVSNQVVTFSTGDTNQMSTSENLQLTESEESAATTTITEAEAFVSEQPEAAYSQEQMEH